MNYTIDQLQEEFDALPDELQDYIMSNAVSEALNQLESVFQLPDEKAFREATFALLVGVMSAEDFTAFCKEKLYLNDEVAENLFGEVGEKVLGGAYEMYDKTLKDAGIKENSITDSVDNANAPLVTPSVPLKPQPPSGVRKFVGIPAYGVEKPASSYTSVLPRSQTEANKLKDTPTADSFIQKLNAQMPAGMTTPLPPAPVAIPIAPATKQGTVPANLPVLEKDEPPTQLAKLTARPNLPRQEIKMSATTPVPIKAVQIPTPTLSPVPASMPPIPQKPKSTYVAGTDPYRETPTP